MLPIVSHHPIETNRETEQKISEYAKALLAKPRFRGDQPLLQHAARKLTNAPSLVLDDFTDVAFFDGSSQFLEERSRLRAATGDVVATIGEPNASFDKYIASGLGFGTVNWLSVPDAGDHFTLATHCWQNRKIRREIVHAIRTRGLRYLHPHMGNHHVWRLAQLLEATSHRPIKVVGPPPAVSHWANDKAAFAGVVADLLGREFEPETRTAYGTAFLAQQVHELKDRHQQLGIKVPHAAGGNGNFLLQTKLLRNMNLSEIRDFLETLIPADKWPEDGPLLVDVWESDVLESASIQTWIPPLNHGRPVLEGIFSQMISGEKGHFTGCIPLQLSDQLEQQVIRSTSTLALLFQQMGYVGRCSFDFLLVGKSLDNCRIEFIECNGRWGGTSVPMTTVNRLFGDYAWQPFAAVATDEIVPETTDPIRLDFASIVSALGPDVFRRDRDGNDNNGWLIPFNPARLGERRGMNWIVLGQTMDEVRARVQALPGRLRATIADLQPPPTGHAGSRRKTRTVTPDSAHQSAPVRTPVRSFPSQIEQTDADSRS